MPAASRHRSHVVRPFFPICGTNHCLVVYSIQGSGELISTHTVVSDLTGFSHVHGNTSRLFLSLYEFLPGRFWRLWARQVEPVTIHTARLRNYLLSSKIFPHSHDPAHDTVLVCDGKIFILSIERMKNGLPAGFLDLP